MISYLVSLVQFSPSTGRVGHCRQISLCLGSTHCVQATLGLPLLVGVCAFPVYTAQAPGCSIGSMPHIACGSSFQVLHKSADSVAPVFCAFPGLSSSGRQELDGRTLTGCSAPSPLRCPSLSFCALVGCQRLVFVLRSWPLAMTLLAVDVNHPESQGVFG